MFTDNMASHILVLLDDLRTFAQTPDTVTGEVVDLPDVYFATLLEDDADIPSRYKPYTDAILNKIKLLVNFPYSSTIVQLDVNTGNPIYFGNDFSFAQTKEDIKEIPGSVEKNGDAGILVADAINKNANIVRAIPITYLELMESNSIFTPEDITILKLILRGNDTVVITSMTLWQYNSSPRYTTDFHLIPVDIKEIQIDDDAIRNSNVVIRQGTTVKWVNNSNKPISIYSGTTSCDQFANMPDVNIYGKQFKSGVIEPGGSYSYKFVSVDAINYFVYPDILTGSINITPNRLNSDDQFLIAENDQNKLTSRVIRVDSWGNVMGSYGESYINKPRRVKPLKNGGFIAST